MSILNLTKDKKYVFNRVVNNVEFIYADQPNMGELAGVAGYMSKADVKIEINPRQTDLINGQKLQLGYEMNVEITSQQLYSAFEFDKLQNRSCYIKIEEVPLWVMPLLLNVTVNFVPGEAQGQVKITGSKYGSRLLECISPTWNGQVIEPWALDVKATTGESIIPSNTFTRQYRLRVNDPAFIWITPSTPTEGSSVEAFKVLLYQKFGEVLESIPQNITMKKFDGFAWITIPNADYQVVYENGYYYLSYQSVNAIAMGTLIEISYGL